MFVARYEKDEKNIPIQGRWITELFVKLVFSSRCSVTLLCDSLETGIPQRFLN